MPSASPNPGQMERGCGIKLSAKGETLSTVATQIEMQGGNRDLWYKVSAQIQSR